MCPDCHHELHALDLIPVISWVALRGRCRYCHKPISWQYPVVELLAAILFLVSYHYWPLKWGVLGTIQFSFWLIFLAGFMALIVYDLRWMLLPDRIVFPLQWLAVIYAILNVTFSHTGVHGILQVAFSVLCSAGFFYLLYQVSQGKWIGGGDVKLAVVLGLVLAGPAKSVLMLFIASLLGTLIGVPLLLQGKAKLKSRIPFGPFLIIATIIVFLFGGSFISWYQHTLLLA
ncbi:MAG TPA: prepilin peptidase [Candidatus Saccharimonadales bacterium]|nr:prepilin peptidase [Candidatus Saccharimonadales bacterium]